MRFRMSDRRTVLAQWSQNDAAYIAVYRIFVSPSLKEQILVLLQLYIIFVRDVQKEPKGWRGLLCGSKCLTDGRL